MTAKNKDPYLGKPLAEIQSAFAQDIRTGGEQAFTSDPRMKVYRELFFNNVFGFIEGSFPVCASLMEEARWKKLCRRFFETHDCSTPLFLEISEEFLAFISSVEHEFSDLPYFAELAHYEWLELAVDVMEVSTSVDVNPEGDYLNHSPVFASAVASGYYQYPVHTASKEHKELEQTPVGFIVYRDLHNQVRFVQCNPFTLALFEQIRQKQMSGLEAVKALLVNSGIEPSEAAINGGAAVLKEWHEVGLILGTF